jgi:hypothetical protein
MVTVASIISKLCGEMGLSIARLFDQVATLRLLML